MRSLHHRGHPRVRRVHSLKPDTFNVVIIDEASQVWSLRLSSVATGSKVVVLGDPKQFSNVKSANASIATTPPICQIFAPSSRRTSPTPRTGCNVCRSST
jgi:hypothetical protein